MCSLFRSQKTFDTVHHDILLQKLHKYGIRRNASDMKNCLANRIQYTVVDNVVSNLHQIKTVIPQTSTLDLLLFIVHINDLPQAPAPD